MQVFSTFATLVLTAVLGVSLGVSAGPAASATTSSSFAVVSTTSAGPGEPAWFCQRYWWFKPLC